MRPTIKDVRREKARNTVMLRDTVTDEALRITIHQAHKLHLKGVAHPGESYTLADGKTWLDAEQALGRASQ